MAVPIQPGPVLQIGEPEKLFAVPLEESGFIQARMVASADARRFLVNTPEQVSQDEGFSVVTNWTADLRSR